MGSIKIDDLASAVQSSLNDYRDNTLDIMARAVARVAKETVQAIRENIDKAGIGGKDYRKSWTTTQNPDMRGRWASGRVVYSKLPQLPHLLEHGHAKVSGGRVEGRPHIAPAEDLASMKLEEYIKSGIEGGD
jgi:hypothetical protein